MVSDAPCADATGNSRAADGAQQKQRLNGRKNWGAPAAELSFRVTIGREGGREGGRDRSDRFEYCTFNFENSQ